MYVFFSGVIEQVGGFYMYQFFVVYIYILYNLFFVLFIILCV